jgi:hypothetical protein
VANAQTVAKTFPGFITVWGQMLGRQDETQQDQAQQDQAQHHQTGPQP